jgi:cysteinyl-tRNA synthetase
MVLMSTHYRQPLDWTTQRVQEVSKVLTKWRSLCIGVVPTKLPSKEIMGALADDLNTPLVFTKMHGLAAAGKFPELLSSARFLGLLLSEPVTDELDALLTNHQKLKIENLLIERLTAKK